MSTLSEWLTKQAETSELETNDQTLGEATEGPTTEALLPPDRWGDPATTPKQTLSEGAHKLVQEGRTGFLEEHFENKTDPKVPVGPGHMTVPHQGDAKGTKVDELKQPKDDTPAKAGGQEKTSALKDLAQALIKIGTAPSPF